MLSLSNDSGLEEKMLKNYKKQVFFALVIVLGLFVLSFFVMSYFSTDSLKNKVNQDVLHIDYKGKNRIVLKNIVPVGDKLGKTFDGKGTEDGVQGFLDFSIENTSNKEVYFEIFLTKKEFKGKMISEKFVKCFLTDTQDNVLNGFDSNSVPVYNSLLVLNDKPDSRLLLKNKLAAGEKKSFRLRNWLSDTYVISKESEQFIFDVSVRVV